MVSAKRLSFMSPSQIMALKIKRNWRVNKRRKVATTKLGGYVYEVDLAGLDHAEAFDWMAHLSGKSWMTTDALFEIGEILRVWIKQEDRQ